MNYIRILSIIFFPALLFSQQTKILWNTYSFYVPDNRPEAYAEVILSVNSTFLKKNKIKDNNYICAIKGFLKIFSNNQLIKADTFVVKSPTAADSMSVPDFIYIKRYWLDNHQTYNIQLQIEDFFTHQTILNDNKKLSINFDKNTITFSDVIFIDTLQKSDKKDMFYRYGYSIIPYNNNYFNEYFNQLNFLCEVYNTDTLLGKDEMFLMKYFIQDNDNKKAMEQFGGFKKMRASKINVLFGNINIKELPSGNYNLVIEIRNKNNDLLHSKNIYFQRKNNNVVKNWTFDDELFFGKTKNIDTLKMWLEALWPIANNLEKDWIINQSITKDETMMKNFMIDFWNKRASDTADATKLAKDYYSKLNDVMKNFKCGKMAPYNTDRGRVYLQYGPPNQRTIQNSEPGAYPYEIWQYYRIYDPSTNQFFTNRKFVFVNKGIADDCYTLIHSDMKGEFNNPNWQRDIMKHEIYNPNNPYQQQKINYGNNFDKLYQNPQ